MHLLPAGACIVVFCTKLEANASSTLGSAAVDKTAAPEGADAKNSEAQAAANK
jgi:hypothetical protein